MPEFGAGQHHPGKKGTKLTKGKTGQTDKPVVVMWHGLLDSCDLWAMNYASVAPAFTVAEAGYDVWLGNSRGNKYCREHVTLNPDTQPAFWDFSFQEMGKYDVPALLDYVEDHTGHKKVAYVGHSQGCAQMFSALVDQADYFKDRLSVFIALAPAVELGHTYSPMLQFLEEYGEDMNTVVQDLGA